MDKDTERKFLDLMNRALVSLPFDLKVLLEAVASPDLERDVREIAAAAAVHTMNPKDGNVEPTLRHAEDVALVRLALERIGREGGEGAADFRARYSENYATLEDELATLRAAFGADVMAWLDGRFSSLRKAVFAKKKIPQFVDDDEQSTFLYDEGMRFGTDYPTTEKSIAGRVKQARPFVDHLARKRDQDRKKITS